MYCNYQAYFQHDLDKLFSILFEKKKFLTEFFKLEINKNKTAQRNYYYLKVRVKTTSLSYWTWKCSENINKIN